MRITVLFFFIFFQNQLNTKPSFVFFEKKDSTKIDFYLNKNSTFQFPKNNFIQKKKGGLFWKPVGVGLATGVVVGGIFGLIFPRTEDLRKHHHSMIWGTLLGITGLGTGVTIGLNNLIQKGGKKRNKPRYRIFND